MHLALPLSFLLPLWERIKVRGHKEEQSMLQNLSTRGGAFLIVGATLLLGVAMWWLIATLKAIPPIIP